MLERWFYLRQGKQFGPVPIAVAIRLAALGVIEPQDPLWPEEVDPQLAFAASATIDFSTLPRRSAASPKPTPSPLSARSGPLPDWLSDVQEAEKPAGPAPPVAPASLPDWLSDVELSETFIVRKKPTPPLAPPMARAPIPSAAARPAPPAPATPVARMVPVAPPAPSREELGFDAETGQILDAAKYRKWQRERQQARQQDASPAGETIYETFRRAQRDVEGWIDAEPSKPLVVQGAIAAIRSQAEVQRIIQSYQSHGAELVQKLWKHLEFMVENRRKYYAATGG